MPLDHDSHEELLSRLNDPELSAEDRTDVLTQLRSNYTDTLSEQASLTERTEKLEASNNDLLKANAKLFNESGYIFENGDPATGQPTDDEPSVSETITLESVEAKYRQ